MKISLYKTGLIAAALSLIAGPKAFAISHALVAVDASATVAAPIADTEVMDESSALTAEEDLVSIGGSTITAIEGSDVISETLVDSAADAQRALYISRHHARTGGGVAKTRQSGSTRSISSGGILAVDIGSVAGAATAD